MWKKTNLHPFLFLSMVFFDLSGWSQPLDYNKPENWIQFAHLDAANHRTQPYSQKDSMSVDVFYVAPTVLTDPKDPRWNAEMSDLSWKNDLKIPVEFQASAWQSCGRIYAPYYQQAHLRAYDSLEGKGRDALICAYQDVRAAFLYFLEKESKGKPFILAGHSQGSTQLVLLMKEFLDGSSMQKRLVAAYLPGIGIDDKEFQHIHFMTNPTEIHGYVTWNTMNEKADNLSYPLWYLGKNCINPVTWDLRNKTNRSEHLGFYYTNRKIYSHVFETELISGAVCVKAFRPPFNFAVKKYKSLHLGDINLFWKDIQVNSQQRIKAYYDEVGPF